MKKRIAFIIQHLTNGGAERTISNLSLLLQNDYDIYLIVFDGDNITYPYGGNLIDLNLPPKSGTIGKIFNCFKRIIAVKKIKKSYNFDTAVSFMFGANIVNVMSRCNEKVVTSARNYMSSYGVNFFSKFREKFVANRSDLEVSLSKMVEYDLNNTFKIPKDKTITIYNPCDVKRIVELSNKKCDFKFDSNKFYFSTAGRMVKQKGQWHLIKAFSLLHQDYNNSELILLGYGELCDDLKKLVKELNIDDAVHFVGFVDNPYSYISKSSCFVLSSMFEGLGNVLIEAMACCTPVVSYDCLAGPRELLAPNSDISITTNELEVAECGILVKPCDNNIINLSLDFEQSDYDLYEGMKYAYCNRDALENCVNNANKRIEEFVPENILDEWKKIM